MKTIYLVFGADKKPIGLFSSKTDRDKQLERCCGSYEEIKVRSIKQAYKLVKGYDILMTAKELAKLVEYAGGSSYYNDADLETAAAAFIDKYGDGANICKNNSMLSDIVSIADNERQNAFALGFETAVSLILSRELI